MDNNLLKAFSTLADATREESYSTKNSKLENLALKREEKLNSLGANSQYTNLDASYTKLDTTGTIESNKNKIWNEDTAGEAQLALSDAVDQQIYRKEDGSKYQLDSRGNEVPYEGDTRRAYMYGTKTDPDAVKFGVARGDLPSSDYRYQPGRAEKEGYSVGKEGYGWEAGEEGVDIGKKYLDIELPYTTATALEAMMHGRKDALANRQYPDYLSDKALQHSSGVSEYYNNVEGLLGDSRNEELPSESKLADYMKLIADPKNYESRGSKLSETFKDNSRTWTQAASDTAVSLGIGAASTVKGVGDLYGLATGDTENDLSNLGEAYKNSYDKAYSDPLKKKIAKQQAAIDKEENELNKFITTVSTSISNPELAVKTIVESIPAMLLAGGAGRLVTVLSGSAKAGTGVAIGVGATQQGVEVGKETYDKLLKQDNKYWDQVPEYTEMVAQGTKPEEAKKGIALDIARAAGAASGAVSGILNKYTPGGTAIESTLAGASTKGGLTKAAVGVAGEGATEVGEEGFGQVAKNVGVQQVNTDQDLTEGVGQAAGTALVAGAGQAGAVKGTELVYDTLTTDKNEILDKTEAKVKENIESKLTDKQEIELNEVDQTISDGLGVDSVAKIYNESENADMMLSKIGEAKNKILNEVYEYDEKSNTIIGIKDLTKVEAVDKWLDQYGEYQSDKDGNVPEAVQDEINYIKQMNIDYSVPVQELETKVNTLASIAPNKVKDDVGSVVGLEEIDVIAKVDEQVDNFVNNYKAGIPDVEAFRADIRKKVLDNYGISGMTGLGNNIRVEMDKEAFAEQARESAGVKTNLESRGMKQGGTVVGIGSVTNEELQAVMNGEGVSYETDRPNTKFNERVVDKLDPLSAKSVVDTLGKVNIQMDVAIASNQKEAGKYFKGGDVLGNMKRLMAVAINTINGQVASDTELRANISNGDSMLKGNEYWASMNNTMEQIGKDYTTSYGLKLTGDSKELAKVYRNLGRFAIKMLTDADLVETTSDTMWTVAGDTIGRDGKKIGPTNTPGVAMKLAKDSLTDSDRVLVKDKGIRLTDTNARENTLVENGSVIGYDSKIGDALKRVVKLMLPNADRAPTTEYTDKPVKVADGITINDKTESIIKEAGKRPLEIKKSGNLIGILKELKKLNSEPGGLQTAIRKNESLKKFLLLSESGSQLLTISENGSVQNKLDNLIGILDNLDELSNENGIYYSFQVDINDRLTLEELVANYQGDKVYARPLIGVGEYTIKENETGAREVLVESILDELVGPADKGVSAMDTLIKYTKVLEAIERDAGGNILDLMEIVANSSVLAHLGKKGGVRILSALQAAKDVVDSGGGTIKTEYIPEKDASASGVFNTTVNVVGRNPELFKERLLDLGVTIDGKTRKDTIIEAEEKRLGRKLTDSEKSDIDDGTTDAYTILKNIITGLINKYKNTDPSIGKPLRAANIEAVSKLSMILNDEKFMRNLAKYPIMTWFYSAEKDSIVENLVTEATSELVLKALDGDTRVLKYLSEVTGMKDMPINDVKGIKRGSEAHKAIRKELAKVGEAFYSNLTEAFPEVEQNKKEMREYFTYLTKNSTVDGKDYWKGKIRTAISVLQGPDKNGKFETTSLYKWKNKALDITPEQKIAEGLATDDESQSLITEMSREANETSMMAFFAHLVDSAQALTWLDTNNKLGGKALMSIHDGFRGRPQDLLAAQEAVEKATVEIAIKYDFVNEMAVSMRQTAKEMREVAKEATSKVASELNRKADNLENKAAEIEAVNEPRRRAKEKLLSKAKTTLFGKTGYKSSDVKEVVADPKVIRDTTVNKVYTDILDMIEELPTTDDRKFRILADEDNVKIVSINDSVKKELLAAKELGKEFKNWVKSGNSFTYSGTVYIGSKALGGIDEVSGKKATAEEILDVVSHEIEHAVIDNYVDREATKEAKREVDAILRVLERASKNQIGNVSPRVKQRINYLLNAYSKDKQSENENKFSAVKELVAISREDTVAADVLNELNRMAKLEGSGLSKIVSDLWNKIKSVMESTPLKELLSNTDVYTLGVAIESIRSKARGVEVNEATENTIVSGYAPESKVESKKEEAIMSKIGKVQQELGTALPLTREMEEYLNTLTEEQISDIIEGKRACLK